MLEFLHPITREKLTTSEELKNVQTFEEVKSFLDDVYVGENEDLIVFEPYVKGELIIEYEDEENDVDDLEGKYIWIINKNNIQDAMITECYIDNRGIKFFKKVIIIDNIPIMLNSNNQLVQYIKGIPNIDNFDNLKKETIYKDLDNVTSFQELEAVCESMDIDFFDSEDYVFINTSVGMHEKEITLEYIDNITKYDKHYQEMKEWSFPEENNINTDRMLQTIIVKLIRNGGITHIDTNQIINLIDYVYMEKANLDWDKVDNGKISAEDMIIDYIVNNYKK